MSDICLGVGFVIWVAWLVWASSGKFPKDWLKEV